MSKQSVNLPSNVTPNRIQQQTSGSRTDTYWGNKGESPHGHTVQKSGETVYRRTMRGNVTKNTGK